MTADQLRDLLLSFVASLTLAEHTGDVGDDTEHVLKKLKKAGLWKGRVAWNDLDELQADLAKYNIRTLYGTDLSTGGRDEDDENYDNAEADDE